ncbi:hypothetical protein Scep_020924 [Stephania cephalantha]|uniref:Proline rich protein n=1 Tax=Stephania cephalantha TaxID=152367 RepID=A0AAP0F2E8_9MAGN
MMVFKQRFFVVSALFILILLHLITNIAARGSRVYDPPPPLPTGPAHSPVVFSGRPYSPPPPVLGGPGSPNTHR